MVPPGVPPRVGFVDFEPLHQSQEWLTVPFWNRLSVDHMTDAFLINRIQFSSQTGGGTLTLRGGYPRFRVRESGHRTFRLATQILHAYRMVHKINTDRLYEMHGTPGGTMRDPELKIGYYYIKYPIVCSAASNITDDNDQYAGQNGSRYCSTTVLLYTTCIMDLDLVRSCARWRPPASTRWGQHVINAQECILPRYR
jgi:hypothetical protein